MYTKNQIIEYLDSSVLTWISIDNPARYQIMKINLDWAINDLINEWHIITA